METIAEAKTLQQNKYVWLAFSIVAFDTGNNTNDIYEYYLDKFPVYRFIDINGESKQIKVTLSNMSKDELSGFIDRVVVDARREGYKIPDPKDLEAIEQYNFYKRKGLI